MAPVFDGYSRRIREGMVRLEARSSNPDLFPFDSCLHTPSIS
jgi:hypothetical protein